MEKKKRNTLSQLTVPGGWKGTLIQTGVGGIPSGGDWERLRNNNTEEQTCKSILWQRKAV